jgi:PqqA peptide cyclase
MTDHPRPYTLIAELTYRCPLRCLYCSNPVSHSGDTKELETSTWLRVLREAERLGVLQVHFTGGEPLLRDDLEPLVGEAARLNVFTNLITSGVPLTQVRLAGLQARGLNAVQLSIQSLKPDVGRHISGASVLECKMKAARWVKDLGFPLTLNVVLHRDNLEETADFIAFAESLSADRLELANAQYLGWALLNRAALLPTDSQLHQARQIVESARGRLKGAMEILFVLPDYYSGFPKTCMAGWGRRFIVVAPTGAALPCHLAHTIPGLEIDNVQQRTLDEIWVHSKCFNQFRGDSWMPEPCRSCDRRAKDFGGCRCQAYHLTGDASATDPACSLAPTHAVIEGAKNLTKATVWEPVHFQYRQ